MLKNLGILILATMGTTACSERITCAGVGLVRFTPTDTTIRVGTSFVAHYQEGGSCSDASHGEYHDVPVHWQTADTTIIGLDSLSGRVTGRAVGDAQVLVIDRSIAIAVHVR